MSKEYAIKWISENENRITEISDKIWNIAELGLVEFKSSSLLADELEKDGLKTQRGIAGMPTAFVATYGSGKPVIGVLGEYDALPGLSQKTVPWREPLIPMGPGHGCGHNILGVSGVAGAIATKETMKAKGIQGTIKFFGCPSEEAYDGKMFMVRDGVFNGVDAFLSHHPGQMNTAGLRSTNAVNSVKFIFKGLASHAAGSPEQGRSALDAVELMNIGVNYLREHIIEKARIHYVIEEGGEQPNVVPPYARTWYYIRAPERDQVDSIYARILEIAEGADHMAGTTHEAKLLSAIYNMLPNRTLSNLAISNMREIGAPKYTDKEFNFAKEIAKTIPPEQKLDVLRKSKRPGWERLIGIDLDDSIADAWDEREVATHSTDVSDVSWQAPTIGFTTACAVLGTPGHSWQNTAQYGMSIGHKGLLFAAKTISLCALDLLTNSDLLKRAKNEFAEKMQNRVYRSPIPKDLKPPLEEAKIQAESVLARIK